MPNKDRNAISESLQKKGFILEERDDKYFTYHSTSNKKTSVFTKISHGTNYKIIGDNLLAQMSKQCKLSKADFMDLIECPLDRASYEAKLQNQGVKLS
jgi:predicted transcriptional regulator